MFSHVSSSTASATDPNRVVDNESHTTQENATRNVSNFARKLVKKYMDFNLSTLSDSIKLFSPSSQNSTESSFDQNAFIQSIFDRATYQLSGEQNKYDDALRRIQDILNSGLTQENPATVTHSPPHPASQQTAPQETPPPTDAEQPEPSQVQQAPKELARRKTEQRRASHLRRIHEEAGRNNALSMLGAHGMPGSHDHFAHYGDHGTQDDPRIGEILEELRRQREDIELLTTGSSSHTETEHG